MLLRFWCLKTPFCLILNFNMFKVVIIFYKIIGFTVVFDQTKFSHGDYKKCLNL